MTSVTLVVAYSNQSNHVFDERIKRWKRNKEEKTNKTDTPVNNRQFSKNKPTKKREKKCLNRT